MLFGADNYFLGAQSLGTCVIRDQPADGIAPDITIWRKRKKVDLITRASRAFHMGKQQIVFARDDVNRAKQLVQWGKVIITEGGGIACSVGVTS